jgi:hypothetical protein
VLVPGALVGVDVCVGVGEGCCTPCRRVSSENCNCELSAKASSVGRLIPDRKQGGGSCTCAVNGLGLKYSAKSKYSALEVSNETLSSRVPRGCS